MTYTTPWRRTTLHLTQIFLTDDLTFTKVPHSPLADDPAAGHVVGEELQDHGVARQQPEQARSAGHVSHRGPRGLALQRHPEEPVGQRLPHHSVHLELRPG